MLGKTLGHFRIVEQIGSGGMGVVYRAIDERLNRDVALKLLPVELLADDAAVKSFRHEAQALSKLNHPNIATIHDFDAQDGLNFLVMEYIPGITLDQKVLAGPIPEKEVVRLGLQLAQGLRAAHGQGLIHRDLKPSNLRVTPDGRLKILDFGLAMLSTQADQVRTQTSVETLLPGPGTLPYMAPEQLQGQQADERSDIYAVGAVLYEMATGQHVFPDKNGARLVDAILHHPIRPPRELNGRISSSLQNIIQKALDKESEHRYQSAKELQVDLERLASPATPQTAHQLGLSEPLPLEIAHVLFMDIASYSKFPMDRQRSLREELQKTVRGTPEFVRAKAADKLIPLPSGDGMALVFFGDPESPCRCALEVSRALRSHPDASLRMGIHTGPVYRMADINADRAVAGGGINMAQRVMDCGDAGHILISNAVADVLAQVGSWDSSLHDLGEAEVKHGVRIHLFNLYTADAGNPKTPTKLSPNKSSHKSDSGRHRAHRSSSSHKHRGGTKGAAEIKAHVAPKEVKTPLPQPIRPDRPAPSVRKRLLWLAVVMLGTLAVVAGVHRIVSPANALAPEPLPPGVPPLSHGKHLAVLPFAVHGDPKVLGPFAEGLNQGLSTKLLALRDVQVASARAAEDVDPRSPLPNIGGALGMNLVLRGTLQGDAGAINVNVDLDEVATGRRRLGKRYHRNTRDLLSLEDGIYNDILRALDLTPSAQELERAAALPTANIDAYELYNQGLSAFRGHTDASQIKTAIEFYEDALRKDSHFALADASLADASLAMYGETQDAAWIHRATEAAGKAVELDANLTEAHLSLGNVYKSTGQTDEAIKEFRRAQQLSPQSDASYRHLGQLYVDVGRKSQAIISLQNAVTLNSYYWSNWNELGAAFLHFGEYGKALTAFRSAVECDPSKATGHQNIGAAYFQQGKYEASIPEFQKAMQLRSSAAADYSDLGLALLYLKRYPEALQVLEDSAKLHPNDEVIIGNLADGYRWSEHNEKANVTYLRAIVLANKALGVNPRDASALGDLGAYHAKRGEMDLALHCIRQARLIDASDPDLMYEEAVVHVLSNQPEQALKSLRLAFENGISPERASLDPEFKSLRTNPAFEKLISGFLEKSK
jgi:serine/threonine protein kinase/tetratricopeptide (TPR) repeat protein